MFKKVSLLFFLFTAISFSQENINSYITEYHRLISEAPDSALVISNQLITQKDRNEKAFGLAGKAYVYALRGEDKIADKLYKEALMLSSSEVKTEVKVNILYLKSLRYVETHELEKSINILHDAIDLCNNECSFILNLRLQSTLGRAYSLSNRHKEAIEISNICLTAIKENPDYNTSNYLKTEYIKELVNTGYRSLTLYRSDTTKYKAYLDSTRHYAVQIEKYSKKYSINNYEAYIYLMNADVNFNWKKYKVARQFYEKALIIIKKEKRKKRIEQILFRISECNYYLGNYNEAEVVFFRHMKENIWAEFQLLDYEAQCYLYISKIKEKRGKTKEALIFLNKGLEKIREHIETKSESDLSVNNTMHLQNRKKEIEDYVQKIQLQEKQKNIYFYSLIISVLIVISLTIYFIYMKNRDRKNISKLHIRIKELQQNVSKQNVSKTSSLSDENAFKLLKKLKALEKEELFQQPNYTLNMVAKRLQTNSSYLSKTVNEYMDVTFAEYSNRLRINSIIKKIEKQKSLQNYTIDALAQEAGYKSVNSFNTNFKKILKVTPSQYLKEIKK